MRLNHSLLHCREEWGMPVVSFGLGTDHRTFCKAGRTHWIYHMDPTCKNRRKLTAIVMMSCYFYLTSTLTQNKYVKQSMMSGKNVAMKYIKCGLNLPQRGHVTRKHLDSITKLGIKILWNQDDFNKNSKSLICQKTL